MEKVSPQNDSVADYKALCERAGVLPHEMMEHPEYGLLISPAGVQKLKALSPNKYAAALVGQLATQVARSQIKRVK